jgi:hypothetical protein
MPVDQGEGIVTEPIAFDEFIVDRPEDYITNAGPAPSSAVGAMSPPDVPSPRSGTTSGDESTSSEDLPEFDPKHRDALSGLLYIGDLRDEFDWNGHRISIRTIHPDELKAVAILHAQYAGTIGDVRAYADAVVAACLVTVDGTAVVSPMGAPRSTLDRVTEVYNYISSSWYPWTIDAIYDRFRALEGKVDAILDAMGKASG